MPSGALVVVRARQRACTHSTDQRPQTTPRMTHASYRRTPEQNRGGLTYSLKSSLGVCLASAQNVNETATQILRSEASGGGGACEARKLGRKRSVSATQPNGSAKACMKLTLICDPMRDQAQLECILADQALGGETHLGVRWIRRIDRSCNLRIREEHFGTSRKGEAVL
ncbi:uncharacterized protein BDR25DRAFT_361135 [Lindgomyces ingoldianus]|uniref:Uncharacterized protein n=1 Tax=Lindgomyces ingoldianus TaxID=673940 RepID=A0ACB6QDB2_9PLEO|nr:uncharacterized protein BDR25DRAFT_361135 [Lindgomyces ingoldianus]KAF2464911.1 hypothetical protein BDR25DRAFT_361135 [Lindgomyces ingoldianus]